MFIKTNRAGYTRSGEQTASGDFMVVFSHNPHKWEAENNRPHFEHHGQTFDVATGEGFVVQQKCQCAGAWPNTYTSASEVPSYYLKYCPVHGHEYKTMPSELNRVLYAVVRKVTLRQLGNWMMGVARIAGQSVTCSGSYGGDGLTRDYEELSPAARAKLTRLPADLTEQFWAGGGHNTAGSEAPAMRKWAIENLTKGR